MSSPSVVSVGVVHAKVTVSPLRTAFRSLTNLGISSDGGSGAPGTPQPSNAEQRTRIAMSERIFSAIPNPRLSGVREHYSQKQLERRNIISRRVGLTVFRRYRGPPLRHAQGSGISERETYKMYRDKSWSFT